MIIVGVGVVWCCGVVDGWKEISYTIIGGECFMLYDLVEWQGFYWVRLDTGTFVVVLKEQLQ